MPFLKSITHEFKDQRNKEKQGRGNATVKNWVSSGKAEVARQVRLGGVRVFSKGKTLWLCFEGLVKAVQHRRGKKDANAGHF